MTTRSIYQKTCPSCATLVEADAKQCSCGYSFSAQPEDDVLFPEDQTLQEEQLVKEYLDARIEQAVAQLQETQATLASDPKDLKKANTLLRVFSEMRGLRAERETQTTKIAEARKAARAARLEHGLPVEPATDAAETMPSSQPTPEFRAAQAAKSEQAMKAAGIDTKECPRCHAVLPQPAALCFCGYAFGRHDDSAARVSSTPTVPIDPQSGNSP